MEKNHNFKPKHMQKSSYLFSFSIIIFLGLIFKGNRINSQEREVTLLQAGWKFAKGEHENAWKKEFNDVDWREVHVPHDWAIEGPFIVDGNGSTGKLPWKGQAWYRRSIQMPDSYKNKTVYLLFDGVMAFPEVYVNGYPAGKWDYGYNSFYLDVTGFIEAGKENVIAVHVDTRKHDSRWYPGAGIYRKVRMIAVSPVHVNIWGTYVSTPLIKPHYAEVRIVTTLNNHLEQNTDDLTLVHQILSPNGEIVGTKTSNTSLEVNEQKNIEVNIPMTDPIRWDIDNPVLYFVKTVIKKQNQIMDEVIIPFGIRKIRFTADHGFYLNDRRVQLKGVNLHHDHGPLGAAFHTRAMERQLQIMKDMGCNAVRTSHNTPAPELLDLCDRMGMLVINEIFDKYDAKADITDTTCFEKFAYRNIRNFALRDRNHPCIFLWSVGNEIRDVQWNIDRGFHKMHTMINYLEKFDRTRYVTMACDQEESARLRHFDYYDVHSWNYGRRYALARQMEPNKAVIISESASTVSTRGFYELPLPEKKTDFTKSLQVSSYDLHAPHWAEIPDDDFMWQQEEPYVAGEFVWTGFDYLGEPTPYHNTWAKENGMTDEAASRSSYFGIVDLCGIPKDRYYLYKSYWKPDETTIHIVPHWNWEGHEYNEIPVFVYTNGDCAELFLNGQSLGVQCKDPKSMNSTERFRLMWSEVEYQPGELKAVAYKENEKIGEETITTAGEPHALRLTPDRKIISSGMNDLSYILVEARDKNGIICPRADGLLRINIVGPGVIAGVGNGNPQSFEPFQSDKVRLFYGKAMLILQSGMDTGKVTIKIKAKGLKEGMAVVHVK